MSLGIMRLRDAILVDSATSSLNLFSCSTIRSSHSSTARYSSGMDFWRVTFMILPIDVDDSIAPLGWCHWAMTCQALKPLPGDACNAFLTDVAANPRVQVTRVMLSARLMAWKLG